jgi:hypothetical protein
MERAEEVVDREARRDRAVVADRLADLLERLAPEAGAVLERAPVLVRALVVVGGEELERHVRVRAVDVDDVEARVARPQRSVDVHLLELEDVVLIHRAGMDVDLEVRRDLRHARGDTARLHAGRVRAAVPELDARQRVVVVQAVAHRGEVADVTVVPDAGGDPARVV